MSTRDSRRLTIGLLLLGVLCFLPAWRGCDVGWLGVEATFDAEAWRASDPAAGSYTLGAGRQAMVDDLVGSGHLDGLTRGEVVELLGPPYLVVDDSWRSARTFTYLLGVAILDAHLLEVTFDEDGTVASYRTYLS